MNDIFMMLLLNLKNHGTVIAANLYKDGDFATIELKDRNGKDVSVTVRIKESETDV